MYYYNPRFERNAVNALLAFSGQENKFENRSEWQSNNAQQRQHQRTQQSTNEDRHQNQRASIQSSTVLKSDQKPRKQNESNLDIDVDIDQPNLFAQQPSQAEENRSSKLENKIKKSQSMTASSLSSKKKLRMIEDLLISYKKYQQHQKHQVQSIIKESKPLQAQKSYANCQRKIVNNSQGRQQQSAYLFQNQNISNVYKARATSTHRIEKKAEKMIEKKTEKNCQNLLNITKIEIPSPKQEARVEKRTFCNTQGVSRPKSRSNYCPQNEKLISVNSYYQISFECLKKNKKFKRIHQQNVNLATLLDQESAHARRLNDMSQLQKSIKYPNQQMRSTSLTYKQNFFIQNYDKP